MNKPVQILFIEDNQGDVRLTREMLNDVKNFPYQMTDVASLSEGKKLIPKNKFDVILLDLGLPDSQGIETFHNLIDHSQQLPIIVLTGLGDEQIGMKAIKNGAQDYLLKGEISGTFLARTIQYAIERYQTEHSLKQKSFELGERVKELKCLIDVSNFAYLKDTSLEKRLQEIINILPKAWQFPEFTQARLKIEDKEIKTNNFQKSDWKLDKEIQVYGESKGKIEVCYLKEMPDADEGPFLKEERDLINALALRLGEIIERDQAVDDLKKSYKKVKKTLEGTIKALSLTVETRDPYTAGHQERVTTLVTAIADEMGLSKEKKTGLELAARIHDIGKINIPVEILSKPGQLDEFEYSLLKNHPETGYEILKNIDFPWPIAKIVLQHHERMDGSGYPKGLKRKDIILEARILGVSDVVEAMSSHRPYRPALTIEESLKEIEQNRGILYDKKVVDACLKLFRKKKF